MVPSQPRITLTSTPAGAALARPTPARSASSPIRMLEVLGCAEAEEMCKGSGSFSKRRPSRILLRSEGDTDLAVKRQRGVRPRGQEERADVGADEEHSEGNEADDARLEIEMVRDGAGAGSRIAIGARQTKIAQTELGPNRHQGNFEVVAGFEPVEQRALRLFGGWAPDGMEQLPHVEVARR